MAVQHRWGVRRPVGGQSAFSESLAADVRRHGGVVATSCPVASVDVARGRATGVTLADRRRVVADEVVVTVDPWTLAHRLLPPGALPEQTMRELRGMGVLRNTISAFKGDVALSARPTLALHGAGGRAARQPDAAGAEPRSRAHVDHRGAARRARRRDPALAGDALVRRPDPGAGGQRGRDALHLPARGALRPRLRDLGGREGRPPRPLPEDGGVGLARPVRPRHRRARDEPPGPGGDLRPAPGASLPRGHDARAVRAVAAGAEPRRLPHARGRADAAAPATTRWARSAAGAGAPSQPC